MILNVEQSSFSRVVLNVSRLVGIKEIIGSKVFSKNTFDDFRHERKIRNRTIVRELVIIKVRFLRRGDIVDCLRVGWNWPELKLKFVLKFGVFNDSAGKKFPAKFVLFSR